MVSGVEVRHHICSKTRLETLQFNYSTLTPSGHGHLAAGTENLSSLKVFTVPRCELVLGQVARLTNLESLNLDTYDGVSSLPMWQPPGSSSHESFYTWR